jgi:WD40 repeat protein
MQERSIGGMPRPDGPGDRARRYKAFISYSHAVDGKLAPALQTGLERFAKPWYRRRAFRVFRDKTGLSVTHALWRSIERALEASEYFILMASPAAAQSEWVRREIEFWLRHRSAATLLIVLTDGDIAWDAATGDFDWSRTNALPRLLERQFGAEPLHLDLRWARVDTDLSVRRPRFLDAVATLASSLRNVPLDDLIGEDVAHYRTTRRLLRATVAVLVALTVAALYAAYQANQARYLAERLDTERAREVTAAQDAANERARQAESLRLATIERERKAAASRDLAVVAANMRSQDQELGTLLAMEAAQISPTPEAEDVLRQLLVRRTPPTVMRGPDDLKVNAATFGPDGRRLLAVFDDGSVRLWSIESPGNPVVLTAESILYSDADGTYALFAPDGSTVLTTPYVLMGSHAGMQGAAARLWEAGTGHLRREFKHPYLAHAAFSPDGDRVVTVGGTSITIWDSDSGRKLIELEDHEREVVHVEFSRDGKWLVTAAKDDTVRIRSAADGTPTTVMRVPGKSFLGAASLSPDNRWVLTLSNDDPARLWHWRGTPGNYGAELHHDVGPYRVAEFSPDSRMLLTLGDDYSARLWEVTTGRNLHELPHEDRINQAAFSPDGRWVVTASVDSTAVLWDASTGKRLMDFGGYERSRTTAAFSPDGARIATGTAWGQVLLHSCEICGSLDVLLAHARSRVSRALTAEERAKYVGRSN